MAKLTIALCILLVACGAQAVDSDIKETLESTIDSISENVESTRTKMEEAAENLKSFVSEFEEEIANIIQNRTDAFEAEKVELLDEFKDDTSCEFSSIDIDQVAENITAEAIICIITSVNEMQSKYNLSYGLIQEVETVLNNTWTEFEACGELDTDEAADCYSSLAITVSEDVATSASTAVASGAEVVEDFDNLEIAVIPSCSKSAGGAFLKLLNETLSEYEECVANVS